MLVRDARGSATEISPHNVDGSVRWSPFSQDNKWRGDLLARRPFAETALAEVVTPLRARDEDRSFAAIA